MRQRPAGIQRRLTIGRLAWVAEAHGKFRKVRQIAAIRFPQRVNRGQLLEQNDKVMCAEKGQVSLTADTFRYFSAHYWACKQTPS